MHFITHTTTYTYDRPVRLAPHLIRLRPRCDVAQKLHQFSLEVNPAPSRVHDLIELDGNSISRIWLEEPLTELHISATSEVETFRSNPFDFLLEPWAITLPIDYPTALRNSLQPYLNGHFANGAIDPTAMTLAQEIWYSVNGSTVSFLTELNQKIHDRCQYTLRETGEALPPGITWTKQIGSCRDVAVLFMEVCRAAGLASRFVSGYQEGDPNRDDRHLHAWAEVYLPGAGWRGFDPTQGLAVADGHIALIASPTSRQTAPVAGSLQEGGVNSAMTYRLTIKKLDEQPD